MVIFEISLQNVSTSKAFTYIYGNQKMSNIVDDAKSNQPKAAMVQFKANHEQTKVSKLDEQN